MRRCVFSFFFLVGLFGAFSFTSNAYAHVTFSVFEQGNVATALAKTSTTMVLKTPSLGTTLFSSELKKSFTLVESLGTIEQGFLDGLVVVAGIFVAGGLVLTAGMLTTIIGGSVSLSTGRRRLGWGVAGIVMGSLGTLAGTLFVGTGGTEFGLILLPLSLASLVIGIINVVKHRSPVRKAEKFQEKGFGKSYYVTPWFNVGAEQSLQSGLAVGGRF